MRTMDKSTAAGEKDGALSTAPTRFLGRQPIIDEKSGLYGYELLFRAGDEPSFAGDPERATRDVVDHWLMLMPEATDVAAFVNCTREALVEGIVTLLPPASTVLEILEDIQPDPELLAACRALREKGYRFALDGFSPLRSREALIEFADFVKIDFRASSQPVRREIDSMLQGSWAIRLAEKIESEEELRVARSEGCLLFQGYFFSRPVLLASRSLPQNRLVYLRLLAELHEVPANLRRVEELVTSDATLCYRVLRLANSAMQSHPGVITSVREALLMVGDDAMRHMVTVALAGVLSGHRPTPLVTMALTRARFCELLAPSAGQESSQLFLLGMLSLLDVLLEIPMPRLLKSLPIDSEMKAALLGQKSPLSPTLDLVRSLEACQWEQCEALRASLGVSEQAVAGFYLEALHWTARSLQI